MEDDLFDFGYDLYDTPFIDSNRPGLLDQSSIELFESKFDLLADLGVSEDVR